MKIVLVLIFIAWIRILSGIAWFSTISFSSSAPSLISSWFLLFSGLAWLCACCKWILKSESGSSRSFVVWFCGMTSLQFSLSLVVSVRMPHSLCLVSLQCFHSLEYLEEELTLPFFMAEKSKLINHRNSSLDLRILVKQSMKITHRLTLNSHLAPLFLSLNSLPAFTHSMCQPKG